MSLGLNLGQLGVINNVSTLIPQFIGLAGCGSNLSNSVVGFNINGLFKQGLAADIPSNLTSFIDGSDVYWKHTSASFYIGKRESDRKWHVLQDASSGQILYSETSASDSLVPPRTGYSSVGASAPVPTMLTKVAFTTANVIYTNENIDADNIKGYTHSYDINTDTATLTANDDSNDGFRILFNDYGFSYLDFDGSDDYIDLGSQASIFSTERTLQANVAIDTTSGTQTIYHSSNVALEMVSSGKIQFRHNFSTTEGIWITDNVAFSSDERWAKIEVTYDNASTSNNPVIKINDSVVAITESQTPAGSAVNTTSNTRVGTQNGGGNALNGKISFFKEGDYRTLNLDEDSGTTANDSSGNGRNVTISGSLWGFNGLIQRADRNDVKMPDLVDGDPYVVGYTSKGSGSATTYSTNFQLGFRDMTVNAGLSLGGSSFTSRSFSQFIGKKHNGTDALKNIMGIQWAAYSGFNQATSDEIQIKELRVMI